MTASGELSGIESVETAKTLVLDPDGAGEDVDLDDLDVEDG